jgi:PAS domain-containing protein
VHFNRIELGNIVPLSEHPALPKELQKLRTTLNAEIRAVNEEAVRIEAKLRTVRDTQATELTDADVEAAREATAARTHLMRSELSLRRKLAQQWYGAKSSALRAAAGKAADDAQAVAQQVVDQMLKIGFVLEIPLAGMGMTVEGVMAAQVGRHPRVIAANGAAAELLDYSGENSDQAINSEAIRQLEREFEHTKTRLVAAV